jgi:hypothetical protein
LHIFSSFLSVLANITSLFWNLYSKFSIFSSVKQYIVGVSRSFLFFALEYLSISNWFQDE